MEVACEGSQFEVTSRAVGILRNQSRDLVGRVVCWCPQPQAAKEPCSIPCRETSAGGRGGAQGAPWL